MNEGSGNLLANAVSELATFAPLPCSCMLLTRCRQENGSMHIPPMETSFSHWNTSLLSQVENPIIGRIFARNPNIWFFRCLPNQDVISSLNLPNSYDLNCCTYVQIGGLLRKK